MGFNKFLLGIFLLSGCASKSLSEIRNEERAKINDLAKAASYSVTCPAPQGFQGCSDLHKNFSSYTLESYLEALEKRYRGHDSKSIAAFCSEDKKGTCDSPVHLEAIFVSSHNFTVEKNRKIELKKLDERVEKALDRISQIEPTTKRGLSCSTYQWDPQMSTTNCY